MDEKYIIHFNTKIKATDRNRLTRENYCIPTDEVHYETKKTIKRAQELYAQNKEHPFLILDWYWNIPNNIFKDEEHYADEWVEKHYKDCMENFDLNMNFFNSLDAEVFQKKLSAFCKKNRFKEIFDLAEVSGESGIYILVLDKYKQAYIGQSYDIKKRILQHWNAKKRFDRLIYGKVDTSVLSIDSFGALDTTRIFYKSVRYNIDEIEKKFVAGVSPDHLLNRTAGGLNGETISSIRNLALLANMKKRKLK